MEMELKCQGSAGASPYPPNFNCQAASSALEKWRVHKIQELRSFVTGGPARVVRVPFTAAVEP